MVDELRKTIRFNASDLEALAMARDRWPEHGDNFSSLIKAVLADWKHSKEGGGKSAMLVQILACVTQMDARLQAIEQRQEESIRPIVINGKQTR